MSREPAHEVNQPVHTVRHRNIKASIWRNETEKGPMYKVSVTRSYREGNEWRDTVSFGYDDLMNVAKLMYDAHSIISALRAEESVAARHTVQASTLPPPAEKSPPEKPSVQNPLSPARTRPTASSNPRKEKS